MLFVLSESVHFLGIGILAWKLVKKRNCGGTGQRVQWRHTRTVTARWQPAPPTYVFLPPLRPPAARPVAAHAGADGGFPVGAALLLFHDGV